MYEAVNNSIPLTIVSVFIPVLFYFLGLNSNLGDFKELFIEKKSLVSGLIIQLIALPSVGFLMAFIFSESVFATASILILIVPGGHISGLLTYIKRGNLSLSVFLTSITSLLSPITIVFWLSIISSKFNDYSFNIATSFSQLLFFVLLPFVIGIYVKSKFLRFTKIIFSPLDKFLKVLIIVVSIWTPIDLSAYILENISQSLTIAFLSLIFIFLSSSFIIYLSKVRRENAIAIQIEALCQNFPIVLGISLALGLPEVAIYGIVYYLTSMIIVIPYVFIKKY
jgi:BASS family bile acid:Na+ symporter